MFEHPRSDELCYLTFYHALDSSLEEFVTERELRMEFVFALAHRERTRESSALRGECEFECVTFPLSDHSRRILRNILLMLFEHAVHMRLGFLLSQLVWN